MVSSSARPRFIKEPVDGFYHFNDEAKFFDDLDIAVSERFLIQQQGVRFGQSQLLVERNRE